MKALVKLAVCGILAVAVQANAQSVQLGQFARTQTGQAFLRQMGLGANATAADLTAAMNRMSLSAAQQASVTKAITDFNKQAVTGTNAAAVSRNEQIAQAIVAPKGQVLAVTALSNNASRDAVSAAGGAQCDAASVASALSARGGISFAAAEAAEKAGIIGPAKCAIKDIKSNAAGINLGETAGCMLREGADKLPVGSQARIDIGSGCLAGALESPESTPGVVRMLTGAQAQAARSAFQQISTNCGYIR